MRVIGWQTTAFTTISYPRRHWQQFLTIGGLLIALALLKGTFLEFGLPPAWFKTLAYVGFSFVAAPLLSLGLANLFGLLLAEATFDIRYMKRNEVEDLIPLYDRLVGGDRPTINEIKAVYNANKETIRVIERRVVRGFRTKTEVVGFCSIFPVTKEAALLLQTEQLTGLQMGTQHVCLPRQRPFALYIGSVGASGFEAKARILSYLVGVIDNAPSRRVKVVYTRPVTRDGLRLAKQYQFAPVKSEIGADQLNRIYRLDLPR